MDNKKISRTPNGAPSPNVNNKNAAVRRPSNASKTGNAPKKRRPEENKGRPQNSRPLTKEEMQRRSNGAPSSNGRPQNRRPNQPGVSGGARTANGAQNNAKNTNNNRRPANHPASRKPNPSQKNGNQRSAKNARPPQQSNARRSDWVYPEGYTPPANARRPQPNHNQRPAQQRKAPPKKKEPIIKINWDQLFVILGAFFLRFAICFILVSAVMFIIYRNVFFGTPVPVAEEISYSLCNYDKDGEKYTAAYFTGTGDYSYNRDNLLISFSEISAWLECAQVGDIYSMRYIITNEDGSSENVVFHNNSHNAFVNGTPIIMDCEAKFDWGEVWVPLSFVSNYLTGVEISATEDSVTLTRNGDALSFVLHPSTPIPNVTIEEE